MRHDDQWFEPGQAIHAKRKHVSKTHYMTFIWKAMVNRCESEKNPYWKDYGGRGIKVCEGWRNSSIQMLSDLGERPLGGTLERVDNNGHYSCGKCPQCLASGWPKNVKWASMKEQQSNKRSNVRFQWMGRNLNSMQWAELFGINKPILIYNRIQRQGWSAERAMTTPYKGIQLITRAVKRLSEPVEGQPA